MKKLLLCGLVVSLLFFTTSVAAYRAVNDSFFVVNGGENFIDIFKNDIPKPDPSTITYEIIKVPNYGTLERFGDVFIYRTNTIFGSDQYFGRDTFTYRLFDGHSWSNVAIAYVTIMPYYMVQGCTPRTWFYTNTNTKLTVDDMSYIGCNGIRSWPLGYDSLYFMEITSPPNHGNLELTSCPGYELDEWTGCFEYVPNQDFRGWDTFTMRPWYCVEVFPGKLIDVDIFVGDPPHPTPEFPSLFLPITMIIGFFGVVVYIQKIRK